MAHDQDDYEEGLWRMYWIGTAIELLVCAFRFGALFLLIVHTIGYLESGATEGLDRLLGAAFLLVVVNLLRVGAHEAKNDIKDLIDRTYLK